MAIIKSLWAKGEAQTIRPQTAGDNSVTRFVFDLSKVGVGATDILELGVLPPYARITHATLIPEGTWTGITADIGMMTGETGADFMPDGTTARTSGVELWDDVDLTAKLSALSKPDAILLEATESNRSVGVKFSGAVAAAAGKKLTLLLFYHQ